MDKELTIDNPHKKPENQQQKFSDADLCAKNICGWDIEIAQLAPGQWRGSYFSIATDDYLYLFFEQSLKSMFKAKKTQPGFYFLIPLSCEPLTYLPHKVDTMSISCSPHDQELNLIAPDNFEGVSIAISSDHFRSLYAQLAENPDRQQLIDEPALYLPTPQQQCDLRASLLQIREKFNRQQTVDSSSLEWLACFSDTRIAPQLMSIMANTRNNNIQLRPSPLTESIKIITQNLDSPPSVAELAQILNLTPRYLQQLFKTHLNLTPKQFISYCRLNAARRMMKASNYQWGDIADIANNLGYWHMSNFSLEFKKFFGQTPSEFIIDQAVIKKTAC